MALAPGAGVSVVSRASPEDRMQAVAALTASGYVCCVTGNGPGDVAAMRTAAAWGAGLGVVLEGGGRTRGVTDTARNAARLVLRHGDLAALASCLCDARRLYSGVCAAAVHALASHLALALLWPGLLLFLSCL